MLVCCYYLIPLFFIPCSAFLPFLFFLFVAVYLCCLVVLEFVTYSVLWVRCLVLLWYGYGNFATLRYSMAWVPLFVTILNCCYGYILPYLCSCCCVTTLRWSDYTTASSFLLATTPSASALWLPCWPLPYSWRCWRCAGGVSPYVVLWCIVVELFLPAFAGCCTINILFYCSLFCSFFVTPVTGDTSAWYSVHSAICFSILHAFLLLYAHILCITTIVLFCWKWLPHISFSFVPILHVLFWCRWPGCSAITDLDACLHSFLSCDGGLLFLCSCAYCLMYIIPLLFSFHFILGSSDDYIHLMLFCILVFLTIILPFLPFFVLPVWKLVVRCFSVRCCVLCLGVWSALPVLPFSFSVCSPFCLVLSSWSHLF